MEFKVARPDVVRAINQRWLLKFWQRSLGGCRIPAWQAVESEDLSRVLTNVSFIEVSGTGDSTRYRIAFHGTTVGLVYGSDDCRGKYLDEVIPAHNASAFAAYRQAIDSASPVYTIHDIADRNGRVVAYERLLLPFATTGETVNRILVAFEFICEDGGFERHELMKSQAAPPVLRLSATIQIRAMA